ncbi:class 1 fructose-bisphosphatase [Shewanella oneidensis MR-1]|uniref:Fructose-1,6-bisphosphatase class 1 n=1 Tax=Shewanella oneidensis (strain ATCC 700550 / JCM 31522 / CIP 106686 / LMG 19005 / NCIMB 14063 / MR-1) TaxID=211586 RepID=F16PA_SHEON|nr:class 1 fructose-bisphosphatase [Shewanella oneidensis]Q8EAB6.1 RecName: Full=Fructose-1,6-bisphosphatase class 1; Short=FBPase class 1; AltName: Full=D-fructose-1,6-bisphosphate 1-phosphohydrolase class 1 [Shewanella oneidensis MR-1]AAN56965.1 fructose-16-bisphosphatase Fbp [Shewanella oneidensis MR-1]MDX5998686.1 class 1 fructose-bisphosphatase [Shewanella oneidensis]MEE2028416.1 Fructose-1,6-bisphosphatase class 1 [Shewanella oneidensis]QKG98274.1 class 1 fructose-bisphosphatase [Shewane
MQTLAQHLTSKAVNESLAQLILTLADTSKAISHAVRHGALAGVLGATEQENVQGETQKKLDIITNDMLKDALKADGTVRGLASEEEDHVVEVSANGQYLVCFDPLDGSSNIDINSLVGTIFSVLPAPQGELTEASFLQSGRNQLAAGYVLYGPSTMLALTTGQGVQLFTLHPETNEFLLTNATMSISPDTSEFAINMSNQRFWEAPMQTYIADLLLGKIGPREKSFNMRWIAAMVGDVHRVLSRGGIFTYPTDNKDPKKPYKLRLMYEANPMAFLVEQAGGKASTGYETILDIQPTQIHQRVAVILGSANEVDACLSYHGIDSRK